MRYNGELAAGKIKAVYNDFLVDVELTDGKTEAAFCGALEIAEICRPDMPVLLQINAPERIVKYSVHFLKTPQGWIFANPKYNKVLFAEAFRAKNLPEFTHYAHCRPLKPDEESGIDFELEASAGTKAYVYVTSIYRKKGGQAIFPHNIDFFETRMFEAMRQKVATGASAYVVLISPRDDCISAKFVWDINPQASAKIYDARQDGINFVCYSCNLREDAISLGRKLEISF